MIVTQEVIPWKKVLVSIFSMLRTKCIFSIQIITFASKTFIRLLSTFEIKPILY